PADWDRWGKNAGAKRNIEMLERYPGALVIAFPLPQSKGTWHCVFQARKRGHKVFVVKPDGDWSLITERDPWAKHRRTSCPWIKPGSTPGLTARPSTTPSRTVSCLALSQCVGPFAFINQP